MANNENETAASAANGEQQAPGLSVLTQYVKDFSFEPEFAQLASSPQGAAEIKININVNANAMSETDFEVVLKLEAKAGEGKEVLFNAELEYAGIFRLTNLPQEAMHPAVLIECPRLLFPFARQIISDATRNGGFPPLMIDPVDFARLYQARMAQAQQDQATGEAGKA